MGKFDELLNEGGPGSGPHADGDSPKAAGDTRDKAKDDKAIKDMEKRQQARAKAASDRKEVKATKDHMDSHSAATQRQSDDDFAKKKAELIKKHGSEAAAKKALGLKESTGKFDDVLSTLE